MKQTDILLITSFENMSQFYQKITKLQNNLLISPLKIYIYMFICLHHRK